jgi:hypothetical protein
MHAGPAPRCVVLRPRNTMYPVDCHDMVYRLVAAGRARWVFNIVRRHTVRYVELIFSCDILVLSITTAVLLVEATASPCRTPKVVSKTRYHLLLLIILLRILHQLGIVQCH